MTRATPEHGRTGEKEHGMKDPSTTNGTNGRSLETHKTKKQNTTNIQQTITRNTKAPRNNITTV